MTGTVIATLPGYLRTDHAAIALGISPSRVCALIRESRLPGEKFKGVYVIKEEEFLKFAHRYHQGIKPWQGVEKLLADIFPQGLNL